MKNDIKKLKEYPVTNSRAWNDPINNLKLDWNEADEKIPQKLLSKAFKLYKGENTNWYPKLVNHSLLKEISNYTKAETKNIVFGTGSDILHEYIAQCFINRGDKILIISPNYDQFRKTVNLNGAKISFYNFLKKENDLSYKSINKYISIIKPKFIYLSNPNNPTGSIFNQKELKKLISNNKSCYFLIDEAYYEFINETIVSFIKKNTNLIITRSLSKAFGAASIRFGYMISHEKNIKTFNQVANLKSTPVFTQIVAEILLKNNSYVAKRIIKMNKNKFLLYKELERLSLTFYPSLCNFILINLANPKKKILFINKLKKSKIYIRDMAHISEIKNCVRITIGSSNKFDELITMMKKIKSL